MSEMIANPEAYFRRMLPGRSALLQALEEEARREEIPIVGPVVGELLYVLARATGAVRILELGTATGYSAIFLAEACSATGGRLTAMEVDEAMARRATRSDWINCLGGSLSLIRMTRIIRSSHWNRQFLKMSRSMMKRIRRCWVAPRMKASAHVT